MQAIEINEEEENEQKITEYIREKKYMEGRINIKFLGKAKFIEFIGGSKIIKINSEVEELKIVGGNSKLIIRSQINKLSMIGGESLIYIHQFQNMDNPKNNKIGTMKIVGGKHKIYINSNVDELTMVGGNSKVFIDFSVCKINNFQTVGGKILVNPDESMEENNKIYCTKLNNDKIENPCVICLEDMKIGNEVYFLPCFHCFHKDCLMNWMNQQEKCPKCNLKINYKLG